MHRNRVPDGIPEYESDEGLERLIRAQIARMASASGFIYQERREDAIMKWLLGLAASLIVISCVGVWNMSGRVSELSAKVDGLQLQINDLKRIIEPRFGAVK